MLGWFYSESRFAIANYPKGLEADNLSAERIGGHKTAVQEGVRTTRKSLQEDSRSIELESFYDEIDCPPHTTGS